MVAQPESRICPSCGRPNTNAVRFCIGCGTSLAPVTEPAPLPSTTQQTQTTSGFNFDFLRRPEFWADVRVRARGQVLPLAGVLLVSFLDFQLHGQAPIALAIFAAGAAITLFFREFLNWALTKLDVMSASAWLQPLLFTIPAGLLFILRGKGDRIESTFGDQQFNNGLTGGDAWMIGLLIMFLPIGLSLLLPNLDAAFKGFYELRDRYVSPKLRPVLLIALSVIVTFGVIHGNVIDVKILFGATADKPALPRAGEVLWTAIANILIGFVVLHEPKETT